MYIDYSSSVAEQDICTNRIGLRNPLHDLHGWESPAYHRGHSENKPLNKLSTLWQKDVTPENSKMEHILIPMPEPLQQIQPPQQRVTSIQHNEKYIQHFLGRRSVTFTVSHHARKSVKDLGVTIVIGICQS